MPQQDSVYKYHAFISYKRGGDDEKYARWLQKKLEGFRIPVEIAPDREVQPTGSKKFKVFLDKTDLGSHASLNQGLEKSLGQCRNLIVVCSPRSAESPYVDNEVRHFKESGRGERIIPFIIDGTPAPKDETEQQCYPPSLESEALGVTLAEGSKEESLIKIVARLLNVDFSTLYQRHLRAQRRFMAYAMSGILAVLVLVSGLAIWAIKAEERATSQRLEAEELIRFMTFDLKKEAFDYIPLKGRNAITSKVEAYYGKWDVSSDEALFVRAAHYMNEGDQSFLSGDLEKSEKLFEQALVILRKLSDKRPNDSSITTNMITCLRNLGAGKILSEDFDVAETFYKEALGLAENFVRQYPQRTEVTSAMADSLHSLYVLATQKGDKEATQYAKKEVHLRRLLLGGMPENKDFREMLGQALGRQCAARQAFKMNGSLDACEESLLIARELSESDPANHKYAEGLVSAFLNLFAVTFSNARPDLGISYIKRGNAYARELAAKDPDNVYWQAWAGASATLDAEFRLLIEDDPEAARQLDESRRQFAEAVGKAPDNLFLQNMQKQIELVSTNLRTFGNATFNEQSGQERLKEARKKFAADPSLKSSRHNLASNLNLIAARQLLKNNVQESLPLVREGIELLEPYLAVEKDDIYARFMLSSLYCSLGDIFLKFSSYEQAEEAYLRALSEAELAESFGGDPLEAENDSMLILTGLYTMCDAQGDLEGAVKYSRKSADRAARLLALEQESPTLLTEYSTALMELAYAYAHMGKYDEAVTLYEQAHALLQEIVGKNISVLAGADRLFLSYAANSLGNALGIQGKDEKALVYFQEALRLTEEGQKEFKFKRQWRISRAATFCSLALFYGEKGDLENCLESAAANLDMFKTMEFTGMGDVYSLLSSQAEAMNMLCDANRPGEVGMIYKEVERILAKVPEEGRWNVPSLYLLCNFKAAKARAAFLLGEREKAESYLYEALALGRGYLGRHRSVNWRYVHIALERLQGDLQAEAKNYPIAFEHYTKALDEARSMYEESPNVRSNRRAYALVLDSAGKAYKSSGNAAMAAELAGEAERVRVR